MTPFHRVGAARATAVLAVLAIGLASCGASESAPASATPETGGASGPSASQEASPQGAATAAVADCPSGFQHLAPELESLLPTSVGGRDLAIWSTRGACWLEQANATLDYFAARGLEVDGVDIDHLAYGVAGRSDVQRDPPYFVTVIWKPYDLNENLVALALYGGVLGFKDLAEFANGASYQEAVVGGKSVLVGDVEMLVQDEHMQGAPYLYSTEDYLFVVLTLDPAWAEEAISKLPE